MIKGPTCRISVLDVDRDSTIGEIKVLLSAKIETPTDLIELKSPTNSPLED